MGPVHTDTSDAVASAQRQRVAEMSVTERAEVLVGLCQAVTDMAVAGVYHLNPDATDAEVRSQLLLKRYGSDFVASLPPELR